jgi:hypothetical protein
MDVDWQKFGTKAYQGIKDAGATAILTVSDSGEYTVATGVTTETETTYVTHAIIKLYQMDMKPFVNPEDVEIIFHSGAVADTIPDLMDEENLYITTQGKRYDIISLEVVRPAGVTMLYKARCVESGSS